MLIQEQELRFISKLAQINLDDQLLSKLAHDLGSIMTFAEQLQSIDTHDVLPLFNPLDAHQPLRADNVTEKNQDLPLECLAPMVNDNLYLVPNVIAAGE